MAEFDTAAAKAAGYSDDEITKIQAGIAGARAAGYSDDEIISHLRGQQPAATSSAPQLPIAPQPSALSSIARGAGYLGSKVLSGLESGIGGIAGTLWSAADPRNALTAGADLLRGASGPAPQFVDPFARIGEPTAAMAAATNRLSLTNNPALESGQPLPMRIAGGAAEGLGAMVPFATTGLGARYAAREALALGAAPGAAAEAVHEVAPNAGSATPAAVAILAGLGAHHLLGADPVSRVAEAIGSSTNAEQAGSAAQDAVREWRQQLPQKIANLEAPLNAKVSSDAPVTLGELQRTLGDITTSAGKAQPLSNLLVSGLPQRMQDVLSRMAGSPNTTLALPWSDVRQLRSDIGSVMANPKLIRDADPARIADLYRAVTRDLGDTAQAHGAGDEWNTYNSETSKLYKVGQNVLSKVSSDANPANETIKPESAANALWNGGKKGATDLTALRQHVPEAADELAAGLLKSQPEVWGKLTEEAKSALIPNAKLRGIVDSAPGPTTLGSRISQGEASILGTLVGEQFGGFGEHMLGEALDPHVAALIGASAPVVYRGVRDLLRNPATLRNPLLAAGAGLESQR